MSKKNESVQNKSTALVKRETDAIEPEVVGRAKAETAIIKRNELPTDINIAAVEQKFKSIRAFQALVQHELKEGLDYGVIPGTKKKTLLKPGAEKIAKLLDLADLCEETDKIEDWEKPFFKYDYKVRLVSLLTGQTVSEGIGSCNSMESKYRWRWVPEPELPAGIDRKALKTKGFKKTVFEPDFALNKRETTGQYGKPESYWDEWAKAIASGKAQPAVRQMGKDKREYQGYERVVDTALYQIPNDDIYSQVNTIKKMSKKRALVDAGLSVGRLSDLFTQDLDDFVDAEGSEAPAEEKAPPPQKAPEKTKPKAPAGGRQARPQSAPKGEDPGPEPEGIDEDGMGGGGDPEEDIADMADGPEPELTPEQTKAHKANIDMIKRVLAEGALDYKDFKAWLLGLQHLPKNRSKGVFVRDKFGNLSMEAGDPDAVFRLLQNLGKMTDLYVAYRMDQEKKAKKGGQRGQGKKG